MIVTAEEKKAIINGVQGLKVAGLVAVDEQELFMDSHGCNVVLIVCKDEQDQLVGFTYRYSSEEAFYDDDPMETFPLVWKQVTIVQYSHADGTEWNELV